MTEPCKQCNDVMGIAVAWLVLGFMCLGVVGFTMGWVFGCR